MKAETTGAGAEAREAGGGGTTAGRREKGVREEEEGVHEAIAGVSADHSTGPSVDAPLSHTSREPAHPRPRLGKEGEDTRERDFDR